MSRLRFLLPLATAVTVSLAAPAAAQARPTAEQAQAMLQARPELATQLRDRLAGSGLTPEQIRARLRAEGYPENLLDSYMPGSTGAASRPTPALFDAVRSLGITDDEDVDDLMALAGLTERPRRRPRPDTLATRDSTLSEESAQVFGLEVFAEASSRFVPNLAGPVDAKYRLGAGDELVLILTGEVEAAYTLEVTREGFVVIPQVGQVSVANLTLGQLEDLLYARLGRAYSSVRRGANAATRFSVTVSKLRAIQVAVLGDVQAPNAYRLSSASTALTALYAAGGPTERGSLRRIQVRRGDSTVAELDAYDYLLRGDAGDDVRLEQGDVVFVPVHGPRVRVDGAVTRPATYELREGETLADVVAAAGGLRAASAGARVLIDRILPPADRDLGRERVSIDVPLGRDAAPPAFAMADGDVVRVPEVMERIRDRIVVRGHVVREGVQGYAPGLTLEEALRRAGGLKPDAFLGRVLVSRLQPDSTRVQLRAMLRDSTGATLAPFALEEQDEVTVFSRTDFRPARYVVIGGAVRKGGRFPWRDGMTVRDLVLLAGGLVDGAYLGEAEIARLPEQRDGAATARTLRVPLDSGYLFDRAAAARFAGQEVALEAFDNVLILRQPGWEPPRRVMLTGEVRFPGQYTLVDRSERVSQLIARAGGLTTRADAGAAYFARRVEKSSYGAESDSARLQRRLQLARTAASADSLLLLEADSLAARDSVAGRRDSTIARIRVGVDFQSVMRGRTRDDLFLEDGDSLHIPTRRQTVEVRGEVNVPTALVHVDRRLGFYVDAAGGTTERANARRAYVIQPNGTIESRRRLLGFIRLDPTPRPGSTVVVPKKGPPAPGANIVSTLAIVAQTLASLATVVALTR